ncbi:hypothetical protein FDN13_03275 [Caloramator sp. E03]|uniref:hypothetical protein n=1 Tax=Caloramator sp. E03 TaxID=2576307 RepID=UPI001110AFE3|nr:hypothetical protein [Caloramator sp. E03]QCX32804.1 hypothetical protein FDN13_03275 [Caloramator sp. E03]
MLKRRLAYIIILTCTLAVSFIAGYFTILQYMKKSQQNETNPIKITDSTVKETVKIPSSELINESTVIIKRDRYTKGTIFIDEYSEKASSNIIGMDIYAAENYFKDLGYIIIKFSPEKEKKVIISREISDKWPANCYVVKDNDGYVAIFKVEVDNSLSLLRVTEIKVEDLPIQEKEEVIKGKVFKTREEAENLIEEDYNS